MSENKNISRNRYILLIAAFIALYVMWAITSYAFEEGIVFWNFNFFLDFWYILLNLVLLLIALIGWIMLPGRLFYIAIRKMDVSEKIGDVLYITTLYFISILLFSLFVSLFVVSQSPSELNSPIGEGTHMAKFGQKLYNGIWFSGTVGNEKGCGVIIGSDPVYPFTEHGEIFAGESAIVKSYRMTKKGEFYKEIAEKVNITLLEISCPGDSLLSRGIFEIKKVNP